MSERAAESASPGADVAITVVSGLPRSGTSLMMQMLAAAGVPVLSDAERGADEDNPRGYLEYGPVRALRRDASWIGDARGHALKVVAPLLSALPEGPAYRVIWMVRDLDEVLASQQRMLERSGRVERDAEPAALRRAFENQVSKQRAQLRERAIPVLEVAYARAVDDPAAVAREVCDFVGGSRDVAAAAAAVDPALYRQRKA